HPALFAEIVFAEGLRAYREKDYRRASKRFDYVLDRIDSSSYRDDARYYSGLILYDTEEPQECIEYLSEFIDIHAESELVPSALFTMGACYMSLEKHIKAAETFVRVREHPAAGDQLRFSASVNAGAAWQKGSDWEQAATVYASIMEEYPDKIQRSAFALKTGFAWYKADRASRALEYFTRARKNAASEDMAEIDYWTALSNQKLGKTSRALEQFLTIPYKYGYEGRWGATADFKAARIYHQREQYDKARRLYKKVIKVEGSASAMGKQAAEQLSTITAPEEEM
ncbi:MAG: tetratricopeptide repeat protein, partial [Fibrobacterota bacterium]